ncbi:efflux RND transporter periplasmic adaptor subunit [Arsenicibacter rosenii]|uniref:Efflux transporter periplasmic adaptor subunit n=1 Tax=Arsenicibacter rosenii TaxID=1750698 RepID=A0A1S2VG47_9BACT|nr:efflux RND transporter periplasmic adaptor subunit [Arsenicibacter rosenii]OIN57679.1 efflux transporter periplasmic adaptor subunit [Arsenicibacter rosenii]
MKTTHYLVAILPAVFLWACSTKADEKPTSSATEETVIPVRLTKAETVFRSEPVVASGLVSSAEEARLSFKIGGIISKLYVDEGQFVRKGQLLATLDLTEINAQVAQAQLSVDKSERDLNRVKAMYADTAATLEQMQNATTGSNVARQNLTIARFNQNFAQIRSTIDGTVTRKLMNEGELAGPGSPVFMISGNRQNGWVVRVGVSDKDWARLKIGNRATITLDAYPNQTFTGTVQELAQAADPMNKLYEVEVRLQPAGVKLAPGLFAKVTLQPGQSRSYSVVPVESIVEGNGKEGFVFTLTADRKHVQKQPVQIGFIDGANVLLTNGLSAGSEVVTAGSAYLTENSTVQVK